MLKIKDYRNQLHAERSFAVGDNYLAGKVLIESGSKPAFDRNPRNCIAFRKGIDRILSIYGPQHGLIYDVLQSRCVDKAAEAIKCCDQIQDPSIAIKKHWSDWKNILVILPELFKRMLLM